MFIPGSDKSLIGRGAEQEVLSRLIVDVQEHQSRVLVLRGEAGVGKTSLLDYMAKTAGGCQVIRAGGAEAEMELAYASLHQLCASLLDRSMMLPEPQRNALGAAFGIVTGATPDRFLVGLAVLNLLADAAAEQPLICLIDDAQWLDSVSAQVIAFVARRLLAESVAVVFAVREPSDTIVLDGLPTRVIQGLSDADSRRLLSRTVPGRIDERVRDQIVAESRGNPLALLEFRLTRSAANLAGGFGLPDTRPLAGRIEQGYLRHAESLPTESRRLLLAAAAEPVGDFSLLRRAAERLAIGPDAYISLEASGLIDFGRDVRFRHPLVRSAIYRSADSAARQEVHRALAESTDPMADPDRRAWHRAHGASAPDEAAALDLERSADRARSRGGAAAAAAFLERSMELTGDVEKHAARALAAATAKFDAADPRTAQDLLVIADWGPLNQSEQATVTRLRAHISFGYGRGSESTSFLLEAAQQLETFDTELANETYLEALGAAMFAGPLGQGTTRYDAAVVAREAHRKTPLTRPVDVLLDGMTTLILDGHGSAVPVLERACAAFQDEDLSLQRHVSRWLSSAGPIAQELAVHQLWDFAAWEYLATRSVQLARDTGALAFLPTALMYLAGVHLHMGDLATAEAMIAEGNSITAATGFVPVRYASLVLVGWQGREERALQVIASDVHDATGRGEGIVLHIAEYARSVLYNGLARYREALDSVQWRSHHDDVGFLGWSLVEVIEAAVRCGDFLAASDACDRLGEHTLVNRSDWALGMLARSRALLEDGPQAEALYLEGIERLGRSGVAIHQARVHLLYGEWLRRENRRLDARAQLRVAYEMLIGFRVDAFAERARRELLATGETVRPRSATARDSLTGQEAQIAQLAVEGRSNAEIGSQLFISPRTVEYHLAKVFTKLGISSRREIAHVLSAGSTTAQRH